MDLFGAHKLERLQFTAVTMQLKSKAVTVKTATLVDATIIASASAGDDNARWVKHKGKSAVHGFKAHVGADADAALVKEVSVTSANIDDGRVGPEALPDYSGEVFADGACRGNRLRDAVWAKGGILRINATGTAIRQAILLALAQPSPARFQQCHKTWQ